MFKRMDWPHGALLLASIWNAGMAYAARGADPIAGLLSLPALLAAFAGSGLILSFLPSRPVHPVRLFATIACCALLGAFGAPVAVRVAAGFVDGVAGPGAEILAAFVVGAVGQVFIPMLIERRAAALDRVIPKSGG